MGQQAMFSYHICEALKGSRAAVLASLSSVQLAYGFWCVSGIAVGIAAVGKASALELAFRSVWYKTSATRWLLSEFLQRPLLP